jgi:hypothetical protein
MKLTFSCPPLCTNPVVLTYHEPIKSLKTTTHPATSRSCNLSSYMQVTEVPSVLADAHVFMQYLS